MGAEHLGESLASDHLSVKGGGPGSPCFPDLAGARVASCLGEWYLNLKGCRVPPSCLKLTLTKIVRVLFL